VAIDGPGASGKTTIADKLRAATGVRVVHTDDFFVARARHAPAGFRGGSTPGVELRTGERELGLGLYYDIARMRCEALEPLREGRPAVFHASNWDRGDVSDLETHVEPGRLVVLEGVCSGTPELGDVVDKAIYVDTGALERLRRLHRLIDPADWDDDWLAAERDYFARVRPLDSFDLVISGTERTWL
jgi:uridine kinase